jgi:chaperone BCS1
MESVVLPSSTKNRLIKDLERFLSPSTESFYNRNGIPYRRSYLFYGLPGTGKTSMIQALAGHFKRSVSYLMPTHPKMTDDSLKEAINSLPTETIVVFEDIDSLFSKDRSNKISSSALTFSGLLNALDGIGNPKGQIFVLTTNLRDQLDQALIRNGRVDLHIEFTYADSEQMETMWSNFYPEATHLARAFSNNLQGLLRSERLQITTANMQHFFVTQMDHCAEEALDNVSSIVDEVKLNSAELVKASQTQQVDANGATTASLNDAVSEVKSSDDPSSE